MFIIQHRSTKNFIPAKSPGLTSFSWAARRFDTREQAEAYLRATQFELAYLFDIINA